MSFGIIQYNLSKGNYSSDIANVLGTGRANISNRIKNNSSFSYNEVKKLESAYNVDLSAAVPSDTKKPDEIIQQLDNIKKRLNMLSDDNGATETNVKIAYRPDVYLSAGYGTDVYNEDVIYVTLDIRLFTTDRGNRINPKNCEIVRISGNSMEPEYRHGDRVIIDTSDTDISDGLIYAFRYHNKCFVKEFNVLNDRIKCISLNKDYDSFYIKEGEEIKVLGRILPRIRL